MPPENQPFFNLYQVQSPQPIVPLRIGKFKASRMIVKESWAVLNQDKEMLWFPVLSAIVTLIVFGIAAAVFFFTTLNGDFNNFKTLTDESTSSAGEYLMLLVYYLVTFFIVNFFQTGVLVIASARFKGENASFSDGMREATNNSGKLFMWSLVSATVGVILQIIADRFKFVGRIVAWIFGAAWQILTYFSLPALVIGKKSIRDSFKESAMVIRKTWGEAIIVNLGVGLYFGIVILVAALVSIVIVVTSPSLITFVVVGVLFFLFVMALCIISSTLSIIFKLALYEYARTGIVPASFSPELVQNAVKSK